MAGGRVGTSTKTKSDGGRREWQVRGEIETGWLHRDENATTVSRAVRRIGMINVRYAETARSGGLAEIGIRLDDTR